MYLHLPKSGLGGLSLVQIVDMLDVYMNVHVYTVCARNCTYICIVIIIVRICEQENVF